ncbi:MAG: right-handed parallel beta-helix repeat-containing protein [Promethearchaeota archaeon]
MKKNKFLPLCFDIFLIFIFLFSIFPHIIEQAELSGRNERDSVLQKYSNAVDETARTAIEEVVSPLKQMTNITSSTLKWGEGNELVDKDGLTESHESEEKKKAKEDFKDPKKLNEEELAKLTDKELHKFLANGNNQLSKTLGEQGLNSINEQSSTYPSHPRSKRFITDSGYNLDQYLFHSEGPIIFDIFVDIEIDPEDPDAFAMLTLRVFDVDESGGGFYWTYYHDDVQYVEYITVPPEIDQVFFNGHYVGTLTGANNQWSTVTFDLDPHWVLNGSNTVMVNIDILVPHEFPIAEETWATEVDWGELILPYTDVGIERQDISFEKQGGEGQTPVDIHVKVHNYGTIRVGSFFVYVYDIDPETNVETFFDIGTIDNLAAGTSINLTFTWSNPTKKHIIKVIVDSENTILEADETNNQAQKKYADIEVVTLDYKFHWVFLISDLFPVENEYTATVDSEKPVERVEFSLVEANKQVIDNTESDGWKASFNMHEDLVDGWNTLEVIAYDEDGKASDPKEERIYGVAMPSWLTFLIQSWNFFEEVREILGEEFSKGSPLQVEYDLSNKKVIYKLDLAYSESVWIPIPEVPILQVGVTFKAWVKLELESTGVAKAVGGGKLGMGLQLSITELIKISDTVRELLSHIVEDSVKRTLSFVIEITGSASFGEGGLENLKLSFMIGSEDERSITLTVLNTGITIKFKLGMYVIFHIYDSDFVGNTQGWQDRIEYEIKPEITLRGSIALASLTGWAWEIAIKQDYYYKFYSLRGEIVVVYTKTDYNFWDPDTTTSEILYKKTFDTSTSGSSSLSTHKIAYRIGPEIPPEIEILDSASLDSVPSIAAWADNDAMMVWTEFTPGASTPAGYDIYYSKWNGDSWSNKDVIQDSSYPDFYPNVVCTSNGDIVAIWTRFDDTSIVNSTDPSSVINKTQLYWSLYDGTSWSIPQSLTLNTVSKGGTILSRDITGSNVILTWYEDDDGNHSTITDRSIQTMFYDGSTWSSSTTVASGISIAGKISAAYDGTTGVIAWVSDSDGDVFTAADQEIYTVIYTGGTWQAPTSLTSNVVSDLSPTTVITKKGIPRLAWITYSFVSPGTNETIPTIMNTNYSDGNWQTPTIVYTPQGQSGNYTFAPFELEMKQDDSDDLVLFVRGFSNISHSYDIGRLNYVNNSDAWGAEIWSLTLSKTDEIAFSSSLSLQANNDALFVAYTKDITPTNVSIPAENITSAIITTGLYVLTLQKQLDVEIRYEDITITGILDLGNMVTINGTVRNTGDHSADEFKVKLYRSGTVYETYTVDSLLPGEQFSFSYEWIIDTNHSKAIMIIDIDSDYQLSEFNESNNQIVLYGYVSDPRIIPKSLKYNLEEKYLQVDVSNDNSYGVGVQVHFYLGGLPGYGGTLINSTSRVIFDDLVTVTVSYDLISTNNYDIIYVQLITGPEYSDSNNTNNVDHITILRIPELQITPQLIKLGENYGSIKNITSQFILRNVGLGDANNFFVYIYELSGSTKTLVANVTVDTILIGEDLRIDASWIGIPGLKNLQFVIDPTGDILDLDRSNNVVNITRFIATPPNIEISSVNSIQAITLHGEPKFDTFIVSLDMNVNVAGDYRFKSWLKEPSGRFMPIDIYSSLSVGFHRIYLNFSAYQFGRTGLNGTLQLSELEIFNASTGKRIVSYINLFNSSIFNASDFKQSPILTKFVNEAKVTLLNLDASNKYRNINVTVDLTTYVPGLYFVVGVFRLPDGSTVSINGHYQQFDTDTSEITLSFISDDFFEIENTNDPFILDEMFFFNQTVLIGYVRYGAILFMTSEDFSPGPLSLTGRIFDIPVDSGDLDTLYDHLDVEIEVDVYWSALYLINAKLSTKDGVVIEWAQEELNLTPGLQNITLRFNGSDIWGTLQDGPYVISDISIYPSTDEYRIIDTNKEFNTSTYQYTEFQNSAAVIRGQVSRTSGRILGIVLWYSGAQNVFGQTNATGHYHLVVKPVPGTYEVFISLNSLQFFIHIDDELITQGSSCKLLVEMGQIIDLDFIEPYTVDPSGDFPTIQTAINNASTGDYVLVPSELDVIEGGIMVNKSLRIEGQLGSDGSYPVINATNQIFGFNVTASDVYLSGFVIVNSSGHGIRIDGVTNVCITKITIINNTVGIQATSVTASTFFGNNLINNTLNAFDDGSNQWDSGLIGNYYSNYTGIDTTGDNIGEITHPIAGGTLVDRYPRILPHDKDIIFVDQQGRGDFRLITRAIDWSNQHAQIRIYPGIYLEELVITKPLHLFAPLGVTSTSIYNSNPNKDQLKTIDILAAVTVEQVSVTGLINVISTNVTLNNIILNGTIKTEEYSNNLTIRNSIINTTEALYNNAIYLYSSKNYTISNVTIFANNKSGIYLEYSSNGTVLNNTIINALYGIYNYYSSNGSVLNNTIINADYGIVLFDSLNLNITKNTMKNNKMGLYISSSNNNLFSENTFLNNLYYGIYMDSSLDNVITENNIYNSSTYDGILLEVSSYNNISKNTIWKSNQLGLYLINSDNNFISENNIFNNTFYGIYLDSSLDNVITENNIYNNTLEGINLFESSYNNISMNTIWQNNQVGIYLSNSNNNNITENIVYNNSYYGIYLDSSLNNVILVNNIYNNTYGGIRLDGFTNSSLNQNILDSNELGIVLVEATNSTIINNTIIQSQSHGIYLYLSSNNTVSYNNVSLNQDSGITLWDSSDNVISNNNVSKSSDAGIYLYQEITTTRNNTINGNILGKNKYGLFIWGGTNNLATKNEILENLNQGIILYSSANQNTISENIISKNVNEGIYIESSSDGLVLNNTILNHDSTRGIYLYYSSDGSVLNNTIINASRGIYLYYSSDGSVLNNTIINAEYGTHFSLSSYGLVVNNTIINTTRGIYLYYSSDGSIINNTIINATYGIYLYFSSNVLVLNNTIINATTDIYRNDSYFIHDPINITGNQAFEDQGWLGSGTKNDPYIFSGYNITGSGDLIVINNTDKYFQISDCLIDGLGQTSSIGIYLINVKNGYIFNNIITSNYRNIKLYTSNNNTIRSNFVKGSYSSRSRQGISMLYSHNNTINDNRVYNNYGYGIYLYQSENNTVSVNIVDENNLHGIYVSFSRNNTIISNDAHENRDAGIAIYSSRYNTVSGNSADENQMEGIDIYTSSYNTVFNNSAYRNSFSNIRVYNSDFNNVSDNTAINSRADYGINIDRSDYNTIKGNTFKDNDEGGIKLYYSYYNSIIGNNATGNWYSGYDLQYSKHNTIRNNIMTKNRGSFKRGIWIRNNSNNNTIFNNSMESTGLYIEGKNIGEFSQAAVSDNIVNGKPLVYWQHITSGSIPTGAGQVILVNCSNVEVTGQELVDTNVGLYAAFSDYLNIHHNNATNNRYGFLLDYSDHNSITNNLASSNDYGFYLGNAANNTIYANNATSNESGIHLDESMNNTISKNIADYNTDFSYGDGIELYYSDNNTINDNIANNNSDYGIYLYSSNNVTIRGNIANNNLYHGFYIRYSRNNSIIGNIATNNSNYGIEFYSSDNNIFTNNIITENSDYGIYLDYSDNNTIYYNDFINNKNNNVQGYDDGLDNQWDDGVNQGNYWSDWITSSGPYVLDGLAGAQDNYPSVNVINDTPPEFIVSPPDFNYIEGTTGHVLNWIATDKNPDSYIIYKDDIEINSGEWVSNNPITINVDLLPSGTYNYTVVVNDTYGSFTTDSVIINVVNYLFVGIHDIFADNITIIVTLVVEDSSGAVVEGVSISATNGSTIFSGLTNDQGLYNLSFSYTPDLFTIQVDVSKNGFISDTEMFSIYIDPIAVDYEGKISEVTPAMISLALAFIAVNTTVWGPLFYKKKKRIANTSEITSRTESLDND